MPNNSSKLKYAIVTDDSVQWFSYLLSYKEIETGQIRIEEYFPLPSGLSCPFLTDVFCRPANLQLDVEIESNQSFYGGSLSPREYNRLKKIVNLYPIYLEYQRLIRDE